MSITKGTHMAMKALERYRRLSTDSPNIKRNIRSVSEAMNVLIPLASTKVIQEDFDLVFDILETVTFKSRYFDLLYILYIGDIIFISPLSEGMFIGN